MNVLWEAVSFLVTYKIGQSGTIQKQRVIECIYTSLGIFFKRKQESVIKSIQDSIAF